MSRIGRFIDDITPAAGKAATKLSGGATKIVGEGAKTGFNLGKKALAKGTGAVAKFLEKDGPVKLASNAGKFGAGTLDDIETTVHGVNNILGKATRGYEAKGVNNFLNKKFKTSRFEGHRYGALIKNSDKNLFGFKATGLGVGMLAVGGAVVGAKDAAEERIARQRGMAAGVGGNAPINTYAYQGHSYADNAGATGDLVLSMHNQRKSGIL